MHFNNFFWNASIEITYHNYAKLSYKYMKAKHQLDILYFQVDEGLMCMDIILTFHILYIIYQSFNVKIFWKLKQPTKLEHIFHPFILYRNSLDFMYNLQWIQWSALWFQNAI
jgi:hypothetical protein